MTGFAAFRGTVRGARLRVHPARARGVALAPAFDSVPRGRHDVSEAAASWSTILSTGATVAACTARMSSRQALTGCELAGYRQNMVLPSQLKVAPNWHG